MNPIVSVIIVNFNSGNRLARCLDRLEAQTFSDFETIVFDNNSSDDSVRMANVAERVTHMVRSKSNLGFAAANNRAVQDARGEWIALLNPDAYPEQDWLEELLAAAERHPEISAFGSLQVDAAHPEILDGCGDVCSIFGVAYRGGLGRGKESVPAEGECFAACAAAALYRRRTFLELGGFDETFFCYGEDVDYGFRLRNAGGRAVQVNTAVVLHEGSGVTGRRSAFTIYHGHRNRIWLFYKNMPARLYWLTAPLRLLADLALLAKHGLRGGLKPYVKAMIDGYCGLKKLNPQRTEIADIRRKSRADISGALCWSPLKLMSRSIDLRPLEGQSKMQSTSASLYSR